MSESKEIPEATPVTKPPFFTEKIIFGLKIAAAVAVVAVGAVILLRNAGNVTEVAELVIDTAEGAVDTITN